MKRFSLIISFFFVSLILACSSSKIVSVTHTKEPISISKILIAFKTQGINEIQDRYNYYANDFHKLLTQIGIGCEYVISENNDLNYYADKFKKDYNQKYLLYIEEIRVQKVYTANGSVKYKDVSYKFYLYNWINSKFEKLWSSYSPKMEIKRLIERMEKDGIRFVEQQK